MSASPTQPGVALAMYRPRLVLRRMAGRIFAGLCVLVSLVAVVVLMALLYHVVEAGWSALAWKFLTNLPSRLFPEDAGFKVALMGSLWVIGLTAAISVPLGVGAAVYLQEYVRGGWFTRMITLNIANLAGVPSIVYGILGMAVFTRWLNLGLSVISGALTLSLLILPVIIIASREALAAVPSSVRLAAYALGATRWQVVRSHVLPAALPGIMTGVILSLSRAIGEAAPLLIIGALAFVDRYPGQNVEDYSLTPGGVAGWFMDALRSDFTAMPIQIYNWITEPEDVFKTLAAAGIVVLLGVLLTMNTIAIAIRAWHQRKLS